MISDYLIHAIKSRLAYYAHLQTASSTGEQVADNLLRVFDLQLNPLLKPEAATPQ